MRRTISLFSTNATETLKAAPIMGASSEDNNPSKLTPQLEDSRSTMLAGTYVSLTLRRRLSEAGTTHFPAGLPPTPITINQALHAMYANPVPSGLRAKCTLD